MGVIRLGNNGDEELRIGSDNGGDECGVVEISVVGSVAPLDILVLTNISSLE